MPAKRKPKKIVTLRSNHLSALLTTMVRARVSRWALVVFVAISLMNSITQAQQADRRAAELRHLDFDYTNYLRDYPTKESWLQRAQQLKLQILASAGLLPLSEKLPLKATILDKVDRGNYTLEKVYFESYPGHFVTGNLYRPKNITGKVPAVLLPHGHWTYGRLENTPTNSGPARAIGFVQQGYVAFTWDMVGYNDSVALSHRFAPGHREGTAPEVLWGINLLGVQLWNGIRAIDFVQSLPEVDAEQIGCTGESGGGTQTFLLSAIDERIKVAAPVNMVSTIMQGGSLCENAPNLRIDTNNVELAAVFAPRPLLMVSATGDWTRNTLKVEFPAVQKIYRLFDATDRVQTVQMNAPHNYNQDSREAVYGWFAHWFKGRAETTPIKERGVSVPALSDMLVFFSRPRPANELNEEQFIAARIQANQQQLAAAQPSTPAAMESFKQNFGAALRAALLVEYPAANAIEVVRRTKTADGSEEIELTRPAAGDRVKLNLVNPVTATANASAVVLVAPPGYTVEPVVKALRQTGQRVFQVEVFGGYSNPADLEKYKFISTYNRTPAANRVQDILTVLAFAEQELAKAGTPRLTLVGLDDAGLWALLARALAPRLAQTIADVNGFDSTSDAAFLAKLPIPGLRRAGDFSTAVALAPFTPLVLHNTANKFQTATLAQLYQRFGQATDLRTQSAALTVNELVAILKSR